MHWERQGRMEVSRRYTRLSSDASYQGIRGNIRVLEAMKDDAGDYSSDEPYFSAVAVAVVVTALFTELTFFAHNYTQEQVKRCRLGRNFYNKE